MHRIAESFELDDEDILAARPPALTSEQLLAMEIDPPQWALKANRKQGGRRHAKRQVQQVQTIHPVGPYDLIPYGPLHNPDRHKAGVDAAEARDRAIQRSRRKKGLVEKEQEKPVPKGNLNDNDYRFWKGYVLEMPGRELMAQCKWCNCMVHGRDGIREHNKGFCKEHLLALYRYAHRSASQRYCFSCKNETGERHWGVPLCRRNACWTKWKFTFSERLPGFVQYMLWAKNAQERDPTGGPFAGLPDEKTAPAPDQFHGDGL